MVCSVHTVVCSIEQMKKEEEKREKKKYLLNTHIHAAVILVLSLSLSWISVSVKETWQWTEEFVGMGKCKQTNCKQKITSAFEFIDKVH